MDWKANDEDGQVLARIAEMLVALSVLAECACGRSLPIRCLILWILRQAEAVACDFVIGEALAVGVAAPHQPASMAGGDSVADLMRLAACFRALALAMRKLPRPAHCFGRRPARRYIMLRQLALFVLAMSGALTVAAPRPFDTS
ncbi:MAG TPA: hypothetical protein VMF90_23515 [Rhizobiaceae bacterium]|nr:hypothetical protein [Rhizobiaceae bacterium]